jgi:hypothetical protein
LLGYAKHHCLAIVILYHRLARLASVILHFGKNNFGLHFAHFGIGFALAKNVPVFNPREN